MWVPSPPCSWLSFTHTCIFHNQCQGQICMGCHQQSWEHHKVQGLHFFWKFCQSTVFLLSSNTSSIFITSCITQVIFIMLQVYLTLATKLWLPQHHRYTRVVRSHLNYLPTEYDVPKRSSLHKRTSTKMYFESCRHVDLTKFTYHTWYGVPCRL